MQSCCSAHVFIAIHHQDCASHAFMLISTAAGGELGARLALSARLAVNQMVLARPQRVAVATIQHCIRVVLQNQFRARVPLAQLRHDLPSSNFRHPVWHLPSGVRNCRRDGVDGLPHSKLSSLAQAQSGRRGRSGAILTIVRVGGPKPAVRPVQSPSSSATRDNDPPKYAPCSVAAPSSMLLPKT